MTIKQPREKFVTIDYSNGPDNVNGGEYCVTGCPYAIDSQCCLTSSLCSKILGYGRKVEFGRTHFRLSSCNKYNETISAIFTPSGTDAGKEN